MQVVVVEDEASQALVIKSLLEGMGHHCVLCRDGSEALASLEQSSSSLVVSDIRMPNMDGLEMARHIRARDLGRYVYLLLMTSGGGVDDYVQGLKAGADDFMPKPVNPVLFGVRIRAAERMVAYEKELRVRSDRLAMANRKLEDDLIHAGATQRAMLPSGYRELAGVRIHPLFLPSQFVSGDMFNFFEIGPGEVGFYAADVSGHGVRSALLAATLGHMITPDYFVNAATRYGSANARGRPEVLALALNEHFRTPQSENNYFTLLSAVIDRRAEELTLCQAGHPHPLLLGPNSARWLGEGGTPLGLLDHPDIDCSTVPFPVGSRLIVYSDGVTEARNADGTVFGEDRLLQFMCENRNELSAVLCERMASTLRDWVGGSFEDDISMIVFDCREIST